MIQTCKYLGTFGLSSLIFFGAALSAAAAETYYVATTGADSNPGTIAAPYRTLDYALARPHLAAGDTISLAAGNYGSARASSRKAGSAQAPITISGAGPTQTIVARITVSHPFYTIQQLTVDLDSLVIQKGQATNTLIENCEFKRGVSGISCTGDANAGFPVNGIIRNNVFHHGTGNGAIALAANGFLIERNIFRDTNGNDALRVYGKNNTIRQNQFLRINTPGGADYRAQSNTIHTVGSGTKTFNIESGKLFSIDNQVVVSAPDKTMTGWVTAYTANSLTVLVTEITGEGSSSSWDITLSSYGNHTDVIQTFSTSHGAAIGSDNVIFEQNLIQDSTGQFGNLENDAANTVNGNWTFRNNVFYRSRLQINIYIPNVSFHNNTSFGNTSANGFRFAASTNKGRADNGSVYNNIFVQGNAFYGFESSLVNCHADYNLLTSSTNGPVSAAREGSHGINGGYTPEQIFNNPQSGDLTLKANSPAIARGLNQSALFKTDKNGAQRSEPWSIGAYAYPSSPPSDDQPLPNAPRDLRFN